jgi:pilus assembly protein Flp/PilA
LERAGMFTQWGRWFADERGATAIEYAIMATGIALAIVVVVGGIGTNLQTFFSEASAGLK